MTSETATTQPEASEPRPDQTQPQTNTPHGAIAGVISGAAALGAGEFLAAFWPDRPGPIAAVGNRVIDLSPTWLVKFGIEVFGSNDKVALLFGTFVLNLAAAAALGIVALNNLKAAAAGFVSFGLIGVTAIGVDSQGGWFFGITISTVAVTAGILSLQKLASLAGTTAALDKISLTKPAQRTFNPTNPPVSRRSFMGWTTAIGAAAASGGLMANGLRNQFDPSTETINTSFRARPLDPELQATINAALTTSIGMTDRITPIIVPNDGFYRIDTALIVPRVDTDTWTLKVGGMVDKELTFSYDDLVARSTTVTPVTLSCVSNPIGGDLVGNAVWQGVPLSELLDEAGVAEGATQIASRSIDGWTCGFPTEVAFDGRSALVAVGMNGRPLPRDHGFPARLVVSGLYGYVSATKWLSEIELTTWDDYNGYWIPRGWSKLGPVKTQSRIDTPMRGANLSAGSVPIAGVAWAPNAGIEKVEIRVDDGPWLEADLSESIGIDSWRQWRVDWQAEPGKHEIAVRATDETGEPQTSEMAAPAPNGSSGWHTTSVNVS